MINVSREVEKFGEKKAFNEGGIAMRLGTPIAGNPYAQGSRHHQMWRFGWLGAEKRMKETQNG